MKNKEQQTERFWIDPKEAALIVVDVQERLVPSMDQEVYRQVRGNIDLLAKGCAELEVPVVATEQYPRGLGHTVPELAAACAESVIEKTSFGCCGESSFVEKLEEIGCRQVVVTGMEAHVCVYQTVLGLIGAGYRVHLVRDAICSRGRIDFETAVENARAAGAVITTAETVLFQMVRDASSPAFKAISTLIKNK
ncbi:MAG: hydrolase [Desulfuromonadales bacterium]|nr:hydrolase [Desulfuromonadales bacterium]NIR33561.1 hydrolase [Desulfuromonadales bacterium]NIS41151.1 hydrolase [Desulfuromonadales bacterium]